MGSEHCLDVTKETENFLKHYERLSRLPLITDAEIAILFGNAVISILEKLDRYNLSEKLCACCARRCCLLVDCELYSPEIKTCPVKSFRPLLCRMHYCHQFALVYPVQVKEVGDLFLESLLAAERLDKEKAALFDAPPLKRFAPGLVNTLECLLADFKRGKSDEPTVLRLIQTEVAKYYQTISPSLS